MGPVSNSNGNIDGHNNVARLYYPEAVVSTGPWYEPIIYVVVYNAALRKLVTTTEIWTTLAGKADKHDFLDGPFADARFFYPHTITVDTTRDPPTLFVGSSGNPRVVDLQFMEVYPLAGRGYYLPRKDGTGFALLLHVLLPLPQHCCWLALH
mgnify:CR=1 FL=1